MGTGSRVVCAGGGVLELCWGGLPMDALAAANPVIGSEACAYLCSGADHLGCVALVIAMRWVPPPSLQLEGVTLVQQDFPRQRSSPVCRRASPAGSSPSMGAPRRNSWALRRKVTLKASWGWWCVPSPCDPFAPMIVRWLCRWVSPHVAAHAAGACRGRAPGRRPGLDGQEGWPLAAGVPTLQAGVPDPASVWHAF